MRQYHRETESRWWSHPWLGVCSVKVGPRYIALNSFKDGHLIFLFKTTKQSYVPSWINHIQVQIREAMMWCCDFTLWIQKRSFCSWCSMQVHMYPCKNRKQEIIWWDWCVVHVHHFRPDGIVQHFEGSEEEFTTDFQRCFQLQKDGLAKENLSGFEAQPTDLILCQLHIFTRSGAFH